MDMDNDLRKLLAAWLTGDPSLTGDWDDTELQSALQRLRTDEHLRESLAEELAMLSQTRAVQSSEPRWLKLEDALGTVSENGPASKLDPTVSQRASGEEFESRVTASLTQEDTRSPSVVNRSKTSGSAWSSTRTWSSISAALIAAGILMALVLWRGEVNDQEIAVAQDTTAARDSTNQNERTLNKRSTDEIRLVSGPATASVAILSQSVDAQWGGDHHPVAGDNLEIGNLLLQHGAVQIEFLAGVRLLLQAPADIEIRAADEVLIRHGSASCFVTEMGRGFRILTKEMEVIDLGTAFSIDVKRNGKPEVHVLDGSVEIKSPAGKTVELTEMHAIRMGDDGPEDVAYSPDRFPKTSDLRDLQRVTAQRSYQRWKANADVLSADPSVMLHYTFEETDPSALELNNVARISGRVTDGLATRGTDGVVIGCQWDRGRWPTKRALVYRNAGDRVLFQVPGAVNAATFLVWARVDALTQETTSLLMTEHPGRRAMFLATDNHSLDEAMKRRRRTTVKHVRWELSQHTGKAMFSVGHGTNRSDYDASTVDHPYTQSDRWGTWACMGVTCDVEKREVIHYLNGEPIGIGKFEQSEPLLLDFMELGNFGATNEELAKDDGSAQRRFYGAIDELLIADRVFDADEIKEFWAQGKP